MEIIKWFYDQRGKLEYCVVRTHTETYQEIIAEFCTICDDENVERPMYIIVTSPNPTKPTRAIFFEKEAE